MLGYQPIVSLAVFAFLAGAFVTLPHAWSDASFVGKSVSRKLANLCEMKGSGWRCLMHDANAAWLHYRNRAVRVSASTSAPRSGFLAGVE